MNGVVTQKFADFCKVLVDYDEHSYWEIVYYLKSNQMVLYMNCRPVYIFEEVRL